MVEGTFWWKYSVINFDIHNSITTRYRKQKLLKIQERLNLTHAHTRVHTHIYIVKYFNMSSSESDRTSKAEINDIEDLHIIIYNLDLVHT